MLNRNLVLVGLSMAALQRRRFRVERPAGGGGGDAARPDPTARPGSRRASPRAPLVVGEKAIAQPDFGRKNRRHLR